ncbi:hypothetical protein [Fibrisoma limi]|uniref:hypothetical protein n=1 Tax=Fibrisoma limi TaxID=663275 RepID=UPI00058681D1|nr:hypothetical protein [Fibrisoma limi]
MKKVVVTPEIQPIFRRTLRTLTFFDQSELIIISENQSRKYDTEQVIRQIIEFSPSLVITQDKDLASICINLLGCPKVILLRDCQPSCDRTFLSNALDISAFMTSSAKLFTM